MTTSTRRRRPSTDPLGFLDDDPRRVNPAPVVPYDPAQLYVEGRVADPNMLVLGQPGSGKSTYVKCLLHRLLRQPDDMPRWVGVIDFRREYDALARATGMHRVRLYPGGPHRLNPLHAADADVDSAAERRAALLAALVATVLHRPLSAVEHAAISAVACELSEGATGPPPTLGHAVRLLAHPTAEMTTRSGCSAAELLPVLGDARSALGSVLFGPLRGMFDRPSTVEADWSGPGLVLDLSAFHVRPATLRLAALACTSWLQGVLAAPQDNVLRRYQVIEEAWSLLGDEHTARYLQGWWALCRGNGVANIALTHSLSDLAGGGRSRGRPSPALTRELLADARTRVIFRQGVGDEMALTAEAMGLSAEEALVTTCLCRGRALWKVGRRSGVVEHVVAPEEADLCPSHWMTV